MAQHTTTESGAERITLNATEARQGIPLNRMRYVLGISLALVVIAFVIAYFFV